MRCIHSIAYKVFLIALFVLLTVSCKKERPTAPPVTPKPDPKIEKAIFFIENSGSMQGYVSQTNDFKITLESLARMSELDNTSKSFYFINGKDDVNENEKIHIIKIGSDSDILQNNLNVTAFKQGNYLKSDLTAMFAKALDSVKANKIAFLISDCLYDVGLDSDPLRALEIETKKTQQVFRERLKNENVQTMLIKAYSNFNGRYSYTSRSGSISISNKIRPYYILVFGKNELLSKYLSENNLKSVIKGNFEIARFLKIDENKIPYQIVPSKYRKGDFKLDNTNRYKLKNAELSKGNEFQFTIAADYNSLPFSDNYLTDINNYNSNNSNFKIVKVEKIVKSIPGVNGTHLIVVATNKNPIGELEIYLKYEKPNWINETNSDNENSIDESHTFGFNQLTNAISEAYNYKISEKKLATFNITIEK